MTVYFLLPIAELREIWLTLKHPQTDIKMNVSFSLLFTLVTDYFQKILPDFWHRFEIGEAVNMSLTRTHPLWSSAGSNPDEIAQAVIQARMLSGRYRTKLLSSNWSERADTCKAVNRMQHFICQDFTHDWIICLIIYMRH